MSLGKVVRYLTRSENNPRNSEGAFYTFPDGRIIFIYTKYKGSSHADSAASDLYMLESVDNGETFYDVGTVFTCEELDALNIMSVSLIGLSDGQVGLFFLKKFTKHTCTTMLSKSFDGRTWSTPKKILDEEGYYVLANDRVIKLKDGRLLMAYSYCKYDNVTYKNGRRFIEEPNLVYIYGSDDEENFYRLTEPYGLNNSVRGLIEPVLIEHKDGTVECYSRTVLGAQYKMTATDSTLEKWTEPERSIFVSHDAPMAIKYIDENTVMAIYSSIPENADPKIYSYLGDSKGRSYFVYSISRDGGKTYENPKVLEHDETRGFCYTAIEPTRDGSVLLAYCSGGGKDEPHPLCRTTIRKIKISEL